VRETVSITSGWSVPCARNCAPPIFLASASNTFDEQGADRLALFSGSVVPASALQQHGDDAGVRTS
jgi:hypothetical protein